MLKNSTSYFFLLGLVLLAIVSCEKKQGLKFSITDFKTVDRIDTLEAIPIEGIFIVGLYRHQALGDFTYNLGLIKQLKGGKQIFYEANINPNILRISREYLAFVDHGHGFHNIGWYYVKNKKIQDSLPGFQKLRDSITKTYPISTSVYLTKDYITVYENSKPDKRFYYEEFMLANKGNSLIGLNYGLYILEKQTLKKVSENGEDIYQQEDGVFYIPSPGLGITHKWDKRKVLRALDSASNLQKPVRTFSIDQE